MPATMPIARPFRHAARPGGRHVRAHDVRRSSSPPGKASRIIGLAFATAAARLSFRSGTIRPGQPNAATNGHLGHSTKSAPSIAKRTTARRSISARSARSATPTRPTASTRRSACRSRATSRSGCSRRCSRSSASGLPTRPLRALVEKILIDNRDELLRIPAARHNHHAFVAGWLEHTLSVTRTVIYLADKYAEYYDELEPPLDKSMAVAGAILHDIGKLRELEQRPDGTVYTASGGVDRPLAPGPRHRARDGRDLSPAARHALAAGASDHRPSASARMGLAQAAHDARGPAWCITPTTSTPSST